MSDNCLQATIVSAEDLAALPPCTVICDDNNRVFQKLDGKKQGFSAGGYRWFWPGSRDDRSGYIALPARLLHIASEPIYSAWLNT